MLNATEKIPRSMGERPRVGWGVSLWPTQGDGAIVIKKVHTPWGYRNTAPAAAETGQGVGAGS